MNGTSTQRETILAQERLHPAVFILPVFAAAVTSLPTLLALLMIHAVTTLFDQVMGQLTHQQIRLFDGYFYVFLFLPTALSTLPVLAVTLVAYRKSIVTLTNRRLTYRTGLISIRSGELPLENVDAILTEDPLPGRMFGYGTVIATSVGGLRLPFRYIRSPGHFYQVLNKAVNRAKTGVPESEPEIAGKGQAAVRTENDDSRYMPKV